jgi:hypothetical protein
MAGLLFLLLGVGNWSVGAVQLRKYRSLLYTTAGTGLEESYRSFQELDHQKNQEVLRRINEDRERYNAAKAKLDFYYVVLFGGRVLFLTGLVMTFLGFLRLIRQDTLRRIRHLVSHPLRNHE